MTLIHVFGDSSIIIINIQSCQSRQSLPRNLFFFYQTSNKNITFALRWLSFLTLPYLLSSTDYFKVASSKNRSIKLYDLLSQWLSKADIFILELLGVANLIFRVRFRESHFGSVFTKMHKIGFISHPVRNRILWLILNLGCLCSISSLTSIHCSEIPDCLDQKWYPYLNFITI